MTDLELERHLEDWLEQSPWVIASEPLLWIGRQAVATSADRLVFPDLIGLDHDGNLVIVELKRGRAPRDVVAQLLEYAAWANDLTEEEIHDLAQPYLAAGGSPAQVELNDLFREAFEVDDVPPLNQHLRLYIVAEEVPKAVARVARFLRTSYAMDISCVEVSAYRAGSGELIVSTLQIVGNEEVVTPKRVTSQRWSGDKPVKEVVWEAVRQLTQGDRTRVFAPREISEIIRKTYPDFKTTNVGPELTADCVNHTSRHHYPGGKDRYWWLGHGQYRLFDPATDVVDAVGMVDPKG